MLHQHLIYCITTHVGVERSAAQVKECREGSNKGFVMSMFFFDPLQKALSKVRNALLKVLNCSLKGFDIWRCIVEEDIKYVGEIFRLCQIGFKNRLVVLIEDSTACILKNGVVDGIACINLFTYLSVEVISGILGLPVTTREVEAITKCSIGSFTVCECLFRNKCPVGRLCIGS